MIEKDQYPEVAATPDQARALLDEIDRITKNVKTLPLIKSQIADSTLTKKHWHDELVFTIYPEFQENVDNYYVFNHAQVEWENPDGTRTSFGVEQDFKGYHLTKHIYPPNYLFQAELFSQAKEAYEDGIYYIVARNALADASNAIIDRNARVLERSMGLHIAPYFEASDLISRLQQIDPAP